MLSLPIMSYWYKPLEYVTSIFHRHWAYWPTHLCMGSVMNPYDDSVTSTSSSNKHDSQAEMPATWWNLSQPDPGILYESAIPEVDLLGLDLPLRHAFQYPLHMESRKDMLENMWPGLLAMLLWRQVLKSRTTTQWCPLALPKAYLEHVELEAKVKMRSWEWLNSLIMWNLPLTEETLQTPLEYRNTCF